MIAALIITAGRAAHRDSFEPQKELGSIPAIQRIIKLFQRAGLERIVVVCDEPGDRTEKLAAHMNVVFLHSRADAEMLDNVKAGLDYLKDKCEAVMVTHSGVALFSVDTLRALMSAEGPVNVPSYHGRPGHPLLLRAEVFQAVLSYGGEGGLAGAVKAAGVARNLVEVDDEGILSHAQEEQGNAQLIGGHSLRESHPEFRLRIAREKPFYGPGAHQLMQLTGETASLREACRRMGISYGKGRAIISTIEQQLGRPVMESRQGGKTGGHSVLTEDGKKLMQDYAAFYAEAKGCLHELFQKHFDPMIYDL